MIAVIGAGEADADTLELARGVGAAVAAAGCALLTGGLGGVMEAASRGAREAGGLVIALLPGAEPADANPHVEVALATGAGDARNAMIANSGDGFVAVGGSWGTVSEIAFVLKRRKPVVSLGRRAVDLPVETAESPAAAVRRVLAALDAHQGE